MEKYDSILKFKNYIVNSIEYKRNKNFKKVEPTNIKIKIQKEIEYIENVMNVTLNVCMFEKAEINNYPFEMKLQLTGIFEIEGEIKNTFEPNAIAILYPYIRAIVSTYTSNANIPTLILPVINVNKMIEEQNKENNTNN